MGESGVAWCFVLRSDVIPDVDGDDWTPVRFVQQHVQSIGQCVLAERDVQRAYLTTVSGIVGCLYAAIDTCAAARAAISTDRKSTCLNSSHIPLSRMPSSA